MSEKVGTLCSHTSRLGHIEGDVGAIADKAHAVKKANTVASGISSLPERPSG